MAPMVTLLVQFLLVVALPYALFNGLGLRRIVPLSVLQILLGVALGPSLFGRFSPGLFGLLFPPTSLAPLSSVASIAVLLFAFTTGLHLDPAALRGRVSALAGVALASLVVPFIGGLSGGLWIAYHQPTTEPHVVVFALAIAICASVTALPVLGAILGEMDLMRQRIGQVALSLAAMNDAALWVGLTFLLAFAGASGPSPSRLLFLPVYLAAMFWLIRPLLTRLAPRLLRDGKLTEPGLALIGAVAIGSGMVTEVIGLQFILGGFIAGAAMPAALRSPTLERIEAVTMALLMPFFFMLTGLRTFVDFSSANFLQVFLIVTSLTIAGKLLGTALAARATGEPWPTAIGLGALMQTKGLMEVVVLTVLRGGGLISDEIFSAMILMALVCTALTMPMARLALTWQQSRADRALAASSGN